VTKKATIILLLTILLCCPLVIASEESLALASLERVIDQKLEENRKQISSDFDGKVDNAEAEIKEKFDIYIEEKKGEIESFFWWDRVIRFTTTFFAVVIAGLLLLFWRSKHFLKLLEIQRISKPANFEKLLLDGKKEVLVGLMAKSKLYTEGYDKPIRVIWESEFKKVMEKTK